MKLPTLLALAFAGALLSAGSAVGCSEPDVGSFQGSGAGQRAHGDDDTDDDDHAKTSKPKPQSKEDDSDVLDDDDEPAPQKTTPTTPAEPPATTTPQQCFTHCVSPIPEAAAFDQCAQQCADEDVDCLDGCYDASACGENALCDQALDQCGVKCPTT
jgi:hypothetical protein